MRLSEYLRNTDTFQDSLELFLFHGTHTGYRESFTEGIGIPGLVNPEMNPNTDFGPGFYMTGFSWQAIAWARKRARIDGYAPMLVMVKVKLKKLRRIKPSRKLIVDEYDATWASTIRAGRSGETLPYDWICGRCADNKGIHLPRDKWPSDDAELARLLTPEENTQAYHFEQIWFGNEDIIRHCLTQPVIIDL
jgi:hypothetical protein